MNDEEISSSMTRCSMFSAAVAMVRATSLRCGSRVDERVAGVLLDELAARFDVLAHQHREQAIRGGGVLQRDLDQVAGLRVHRGLPELFGLHLRQALEALDVHL